MSINEHLFETLKYSIHINMFSEQTINWNVLNVQILFLHKINTK